MDLLQPVYKPIGQTPLQLITQFREIYPQYAHQKISCAGRLDPMAEGILLLLIGNENKNRIRYEKLNKKYTFKVIFGLETDTYDILGLLTKEISNKPTVIDQKKLEQVINSFLGKQKQKYPPYSSVHVQGKPLFYWARNNKLETVTIPTHEIEIYTITTEKLAYIKTPELEKQILERISKIDGNFRQKEILKTWKDFFQTTQNSQFPILECTIECSSGTYIRQIVHELGQQLNIPALTYEITRTAVGEFTNQNTLKLASKN